MEVAYYDEDEDCIGLLSTHHPSLIVHLDRVEYIEVEDNGKVVKREYS